MVKDAAQHRTKILKRTLEPESPTVRAASAEKKGFTARPMKTLCHHTHVITGFCSAGHRDSKGTSRSSVHSQVKSSPVLLNYQKVKVLDQSGAA